MRIWLAAAVMLVLIGVLFVLLYLASKKKKRWLSTAGIIVGVLVMILAFYLPGIFIFSALDRLDPAKTTKNADPTATTVSTITSQPVEPTTTTTARPTAAPTVLPTLAPSPTPTPAAQDLALHHPDVLGIKETTYTDMPLFTEQNELTRYILVNFLNDQFDLTFFLAAELAPDEVSAYQVLDSSCATALSYYLFSAFMVENMYTVEQQDGRHYARIEIIFTHPERDALARQKAAEFIKEHPVPPDGLDCPVAEKAYARLIHNFIARKVIYAPIGYEPEKLQGLEKYAAYQEAYNVLADTAEEAVCAGYARAFALIAQYAGINATYVYGNDTGTESHAWNVIYPCDGSEPVLVDVTWDDTDSADFPGQKHVSDRYFYIPLSAEDEHEADAYFAEFLTYINGR
jgi:hypothetical protein